MPRFGGFETIGAPAEAIHERGFVASVWQARRVGSGENRLFAIKVYAARAASSEVTAAEEGLNGQRHRAFLEGVKQLKEASAGGKHRNLTPVYDSGFSDEGAWYATDFYPRGSLKTWISRRGEIDGAALKHVLHEVITGCLRLKQARGHGHGNIKAANVFLTGKPRPLRKTRLVLGDPFPAAPLQLAQLDLANRSGTSELLQPVQEAQDLRALGELILQLVEGRLIRGAQDYTYPIASSESWQKLGGDAERWRQMCNRLLDPQLSLDAVNLSVLEQELRPSAAAARLPAILGGIGAVCLLAAVGAYFLWPGENQQSSNVAKGGKKEPGAQGQGATEPQDATELRSAQAEFDLGNYRAVLALCAKHPNESRFASLSNRAIAEQQHLQRGEDSFAKGDYTFIEGLRLEKFSSKAPFASLLKQAEEERQLLQSLWGLTNSLPELKRRLADARIARIQKPPFEQLRAWAYNQPTSGPAPPKDLATAQALFDQGEYDQVLATCARYPNDGRFTTLESSARAERQQLQEAEKRFADGDYAFIETLQGQSYSAKPPFATVLKQAGAEQQLLAGLLALTNSLPQLQQRLSAPPVASITKPPFQELRKWAMEESRRLAGQAKDIQAARDFLGQGDYTNVLAICANYPNSPPFAELAVSASTEQQTLTTAITNFDRGEYGFVDSLRKEPFSAKPAFARLLAEASRERALLEKLQALQQRDDWAKFYAEMAKAEVAGIKKPPFDELRESLVLRNQELIKELRRHQARLGTLPKGESPPLDVDGKPVVRLSRTRPALVYSAPLRQLKQQFQQINQLTAERKREFEELENVIAGWFR